MLRRFGGELAAVTNDMLQSLEDNGLRLMELGDEIQRRHAQTALAAVKAEQLRRNRAIAQVRARLGQIDRRPNNRL